LIAWIISKNTLLLLRRGNPCREKPPKKNDGGRGREGIHDYEEIAG